MHDSTGNWHGLTGFGHGGFGLLFWVLIIVLIVLLINKLAGK